MNDFYFWLYEHYAAPQFQTSEAEFPLFYQEQKREWQEAAERCPTGSGFSPLTCRTVWPAAGVPQPFPTVSMWVRC